MPTNKTPTIVINGRSLPAQAIEFELGRLVQFYRQHMPDDQVRQQLPMLQEKAVEQAIGAFLLTEEAARLDIPVTDEDVATSLAQLRKEVGGAAKLAELLKKQNVSEDDLREQIRRGRRVDLLIEKVTSGVADPTEADIRAHYDEHQDEYTRAERAQAQHILVSPTAKTAEAKAAARTKLEEIRKRVQAGAKFADEAAAHSECPSGKQAGGSLGWFSRGMMVPAFDQAAFSMNVGELSEIIETQFGFHIIQKTGHEEAATEEFDNVREKIRDFLRHARRGALLADHVDELKAKAKIEFNPATA
jgi:peptidyl-prolyl cis-trans isomerase C